jgi:hypothetical protein
MEGGLLSWTAQGRRGCAGLILGSSPRTRRTRMEGLTPARDAPALIPSVMIGSWSDHPRPPFLDRLGKAWMRGPRPRRARGSNANLILPGGALRLKPISSSRRSILALASSCPDTPRRSNASFARARSRAEGSPSASRMLEPAFWDCTSRASRAILTARWRLSQS